MRGRPAGAGRRGAPGSASFGGVRRLGFTVLASALLVAAPAAGFVWPNTVVRVEKQLKSHDVAVRRQAAARLVELPAAVARKLVPAALEDADAEVRLSAAEVALQLRMHGVGRRVVSWLNDPERRIRLSAAQVLEVSPVPRAVAPLGRVLGDPDPAVREAAARALGASGSKDAVMPLLGHLDDTTPKVRRAVIRALARLGDRQAVVPLIGKIQDSRALVRRSVARALGELGDPRASSALVLALRDNDESVRIAALVALGQLHDKQATLAIVSLLNDDPREPVRAAALGALARIPSPEGLEALVAALGSDDPDSPSSPVRSALAEVGDRAVPRLLQCLVGQPSSRLADGCALALGQIGSSKAAKAIESALRRGVVRPRAALRALSMLHEPASLPTVLEHLADPDPTVRRAAIDATAALLDPHKPDGRAVEPIARALDAARSSKAERVALALLLGRTGSPRAAKVLIPIAQDADDGRLRIAAIQALGMLGPAGQDKALLSALGDEDGGIRLAAAVALERSASGASARVLLDRLERSASQDRRALAIALSGALARSKNPRDAERAERFMQSSRGGERDAMIEALGRIPGARGSSRLVAMAGKDASVADRAKLAEALASHPEAAGELRRLAVDVDGSVRANAVWALGAVGTAADLGALEHALSDRDVAVAGDAAAALGRIAARTHHAEPALCKALDDARSYVRANALAALRVAGQRCGDGMRARRLLVDDRSAVARAAAAALIGGVPSKRPLDDEHALARCAQDDTNGRVAVQCAHPPKLPSAGTEPVSVYVVPMGSSEPAPRAPFALVLADGLMRLGLTDRRGEVFEIDAPRGYVSLAVPAPLAR